MKYGLSKATIDKICGVFAQFPEVQKAVLYGSRAKGGYKTGSDIDLTLYGKALTSSLRGDIADALDDLLLPYSIDLSLFDELENDKLREHITRVGVVFYEGGFKSGWQSKPVEECIEKVKYTQKVLRKDFLAEGFYPIISQEEDKINGYWNNKNDLFMVDKPLVIFGDHTQILKYVEHDFVLGADGVKILKPKDFLNPRFFYYALIAQPSMTLGYARHYRILKEKAIYFPPLPEQQQIVAILDEAFAAIHKAKENAEKNLKNARELFESYLQSVFANAGDGWDEKSVKDITEVKNGYAFASKDFKATNAIKSIKITNVGVKEFVEEVDNYLPEKYTETFKDFQVREGNIVIALTRTIIAAGLKVAVVPQSYNGALINQRVAALVPNEKLVNQRYLYNFLTTDGVAKYVLAHVNTLMQPNLSINDLKNLPVPLAPLKTQERIVTKLDSLSLETKKLEDIYRKKLASLEELKKSLLQKAFSGQLTATSANIKRVQA